MNAIMLAAYLMVFMKYKSLGSDVKAFLDFWMRHFSPLLNSYYYLPLIWLALPLGLVFSRLWRNKIQLYAMDKSRFMDTNVNMELKMKLVAYYVYLIEDPFLGIMRQLKTIRTYIYALWFVLCLLVFRLGKSKALSSQEGKYVLLPLGATLIPYCISFFVNTDPLTRQHAEVSLASETYLLDQLIVSENRDLQLILNSDNDKLLVPQPDFHSRLPYWLVFRTSNYYYSSYWPPYMHCVNMDPYNSPLEGVIAAADNAISQK
jgi:hypothetical protein